MSIIRSFMVSVTLHQEVPGSLEPDIPCDGFVSLFSSQETRLKPNSFGYSCTVISKLFHELSGICCTKSFRLVLEGEGILYILLNHWQNQASVYRMWDWNMKFWKCGGDDTKILQCTF